MNQQKLYEKNMREFRDRVIEELDGDIDAIIVYGSVARGKSTEDSDIDILIVSRQKEEIKDKVLDISYDIDLNSGTVTTHIYMTPDEFDQMMKLGQPLIINILKYGKPLYDSGFFRARSHSIPKPSREVVDEFYRKGLRRLEIAREELNRYRYDVVAHDAFKAAYFVAESLMLAKGQVPNGRRELLSNFDELARLNELDGKADQLDVDKADALEALSLAERLLKLAEAEIYGEKREAPIEG